jgi:hypothetical protein
MAAVRGAFAQDERRRKPHRLRRVQLLLVAREDQHRSRVDAQLLANHPVGGRFEFLTDGGVEEPLAMAGEVARGAMAEQQLLRQFRIGRIDEEAKSGGGP